jgi:hypothetical protein
MNVRRTLAATLAATTLAAGGTVATASTAHAEDEVPSVTISLEDGANGPAVANAISKISTDDRGAFVSEAVSKAFEEDGGDYNVVMQNLSQGYDAGGLEGVKLYANVSWGSIHYGLWIVDAGTFKNTGDGGYINWAFQGWWDRPDDQTVVFKRP